MPSSIQLGSLAFPTTLLVLMAAVGLGLLAARYAARYATGEAAREAAEDATALMWRALLVALVTARLIFVWEYRAAYFEAPLDIVNIRDGGWDPQAGVIGGWIYVLASMRSKPALRRALAAGAGIASLVWLAGYLALAIQTNADARLEAAKLSSVEGSSVALTQFKGKPTVVNLWATWCPPCQRELPVLQRAQDRNPQLHFVFVNQRETAAKVQGFIGAKHHGLRNVLLDPRGEVSAKFNSPALPTTLFFDAEGRLAATHVGELTPASLAHRLEQIAWRSLRAAAWRRSARRATRSDSAS